MAVVFAAMSVFVFLRVDGALTGSLDRELQLQAREVAARAQRDGELLDRDTAGAVATVAETVAPGGRVLNATRPGLPTLLAAADLARVTSGGTIRRDTRLPGLDRTWRLLAFPVTVEGRPAAGIVAASLAGRDDTRDHLLAQLLLAGPLALGVAALGGYLLAASALRPVEEMRRRAAAISGATAGARLPVPPARDEVSRLATTLNATLDRLDEALGRERRLVADASHELRTPLALLRTELELALRHRRSPAELEAAIRSAAEEAERLTRLAEDLLLIARSDAGELPLRRERVLIADAVAGIVQRFERRAAAAGRPLEVDCEPDLAVDADPLRLDQAIGNLVENALAHGSGTVTISARRENALVDLHVSDEGRGFPAGFAARAFERFSRGDDARGRGGSGLGLAIVELIARSHGGSVGVSGRDGGGADVYLSVPAA